MNRLLPAGLLICFLCASCGLDIYYYLEAPILIASPSEDDPLSRVYNFQTNDSGNSAPPIFNIYKGVNVFYRIYNSKDKMSSDSSTIASRNSQYSSNGVQALQSLGYQLLMSSGGQIPLIAKDLFNRTVEIRLFKEGEGTSPYEPGIRVGGNPVPIGIPLRAVGDNWYFDFFVTGGTSPVPSSSDIDVAYTSGAGDTVWYVNAYAVSAGTNEFYSSVYSSVVHLGWIKIAKK